MRKSTKLYITSGAFFLAFVVFTLLVAKCDVETVNVLNVLTGDNSETTAIGFATINTAVADLIGVHMVWYKITDILGYLALLVVAFFGLLGILQLVQRKSIAKVDKDIIALGGFYVVVLAFYVIFEKVTINMRPVIVDLEEGLEASYPSSHTMLAVCVFTTAIFQFNSRIKSDAVAKVIDIVCAVLLVVTVIGRLISGVHWFTDIMGGLLLSASLIICYCATVIRLKGKKKS